MDATSRVQLGCGGAARVLAAKSESQLNSQINSKLNVQNLYPITNNNFFIVFIFLAINFRLLFFFNSPD